MTKEEILKKSFEKARNGGWKETCWYEWSVYAWEDYSENIEHYMFIFRHDFAKAFWGDDVIEVEFKNIKEKDVDVYSNRISEDSVYGFGGIIAYPYNEGAGPFYVGKAWQYHLQQMVLEEDPIKYLEQFLKGGDNNT